MRFKLIFEIRNPSIADFVGDQRAQFWIAERYPTPRCHAIGDVKEFFRRHGVEIAEHGLFEKLRMERRDAVDRVTAYARKMSHAHIFFPGFIDQ